MTTLFKEVSYSLAKLIQDVEMGEIGLPEIQRPFVWPNTKVRDLFDSMYRGFPIGYLLFWANGLDNGTHRQIGVNSKQKVPRLLIVDGQQRLTSLFAVIKGIDIVRSDYAKERIYIAFCPKDESFEVTDSAIRRNPEYIQDISQLWSANVSRNRFVKDFIKRLRSSREVTEAEEDELSERIDRLYDLQNYPFTALELSSSVSEEQVAEIFVRINSEGTTLNQADFILTLMSVFWDDGRIDLERFCRAARQPGKINAASPFNYFIEPDPDQLLRVSVGLAFRRARLRYVYSILRGKDLETEKFSEERRETQFDILKQAQSHTLDLQNWHEFLKAIRLSGYRSTKMISSKTVLLYCYVFFLIGKRDYEISNYMLRNLIARWFFMTSLTARYTDSSETRMEQDLAELRSIKTQTEFVGLFDTIISNTFTEDYWHINLPMALATASSNNPAQFAYYAALNILGAKVLFSKMTVSDLLDPAIHGTKAAIERHHLFPKKYLERIGISGTRETNQVANYGLVEWSDNIEISDQAPSGYLPKYANRYTQKELREMYYWHALPVGWENMPYHEFLDARRKAMAQVIRDGFERLKETK